MPQKVRIPNFGEVLFPDGMTPEAIAQAIHDHVLPQRDQGATPFVSSEVRAKNRAEALKPVETEQPSVLARVGRGMLDIGQGLDQKIRQLHEAVGSEQQDVLWNPETKQYEPRQRPKMETAAEQIARVNDELALYDKGRQAAGGGVDLARIAGNVVATLPLAAVGPAGATIPARAAAGALQGAAAGGAQFTPSGELKDTAINAALGGAAGAVAAPVVGALTDKALKFGQKLIGAFRGMASDANPYDAIASIPEFRELPETIQRNLIAEAQAQIRSTGAFNAEQLARKANLLAQGTDDAPMQLTKSMVTRDPADWTLERNLQKLAQSPDEQLSQTGRQLTDVYTANDKALTATLKKLSANLPRGSAEAQGMTVMQSLDDLAKASQKDVGALYKVVRETKGDQLASDARAVLRTLDDPDVADDAYAEPVLKSIRNRLRRYGMIDAEGKETAETLTVSQAEEFRKFLQALKGDPREDRILAKFIKATDEDVLGGAGEDAFGGARTAAKERFAMLDNPATQRALNTLGELQQGKTAQNFIQTNVINAADQDVVTLVDTLAKLPAEKSTKALDALRAGILQHLEDAAGNPNNATFSGAKFNRAIEELGEAKLTKILGAEQAGRLKNLARAALDATYQPPYAAVNNSNTAPMLMSLMQKARTVPGVPLLVTDEAQRMAAQSAYRRQLAEALSARSRAPLPQIPQSATSLANVLRAGAAAAPSSATQQKRKR